MPQNRQNYVREERNGKVVYVKAPVKQSSLKHKSSSKQQLRSRANFSQPFYHQLLYRPLIQFSQALFGTWIPWVVCAGAGIFTIGLGWFSWEVISNPDMTFWVNQFAPGGLNKRIPAQDQPKTLGQILKLLDQDSQSPGAPIALEIGAQDFSQAKQLVIPILRQQNTSDCRQCDYISELQVYQALDLPILLKVFQQQQRFRLVDRMVIAGPSERDLKRLITTITRTGLPGGSTTPMPMLTIEPMDSRDSDAIWLMLSGLQSQGNATASYGQLLHFSFKQSKLSLMMDWISPSGSFPTWENITGDDAPELLINQSIGLEPSFAAFKVSRAPSGVTLINPITLSKPALKNSVYVKALKLANDGLWGASLQNLKRLKQNPQVSWTDQAQTQFDLIQRHAAFASKKAEQTSASVVETIQTLLLNGEWTKAKDLLLNHPQQYPEIKILLSTDTGAIRDRLNAAISASPNHMPVLTWLVIRRLVIREKADTLSWIKTQSLSSAQQKQLNDLVKTLETFGQKPPPAKKPKSIQKPPQNE